MVLDLGTIDQYRHLFMDASYWAPFVKAVCDIHGLRPAHNIITSDMPGTYPVFIVDDMWILKFFGTHFDGQSTDCPARHRNWGSLPERLIGQIDEFLLSPEELVDCHNQPAFLHGDLTADHVLVARNGSDWRLRVIIDYGDAIMGDPMYKLVALHLDMFRCEKRLLHEYLLDEYLLDDGHQDSFGSEVARKLMSQILTM